MNLRTVLVCSLAVVASLSVAQTVKVTRKSGTTETMNKVKPGMGINVHDRAFFKTAVETNLMEIKLGELAQRKGTSSWTREYGKTMATEHTQGWNELKVIGWKTKMPASKKLSAENQKMVNMMAKMSGPAFDKHYRAMMINGHGDFGKKIEDEIKFGNNSLIRNFAITAGPVVILHQKMATRKLTKI